MNLEAGYRFAKRYKVSAAVYNVFDSKDSDITYFTESQLAMRASRWATFISTRSSCALVRVTLSGSFESGRRSATTRSVAEFDR